MHRAALAAVVLLGGCKPSAESNRAVDAPIPSLSASVAPVAASAFAAPDASAFAHAQMSPPPFVELAKSGIGFDDLVYAPGLRKIVAPGGGTGELDLVDEDSFEITKIGGFSVKKYAGGHGDSITSASFDETHLFVVDRTSREIAVVDLASKAISSRARLGGAPDYVRWVAATNEAWVTEPESERIEIFHREPDGTLKAARTIDVKGGPESLVVDDAMGIAFTNLWAGSTLDIDVKKHAVLSTWPNGCKGSRGIAEDPRTGFVFVGCAEGKAVVLDAQHGGKIVRSEPTGDGVDIIAYDARLSHLYVPAAKSGTLTAFLVGASGALEKTGEEEIPRGSHCAVVDDRDDVFLCDPANGKLVVMHDHWSPKDR